jgi:hypothetical protein
MTTHFIVRAEMVDPSVRDAFNTWYENEHLPDAVQAFGARRAWRGWSEVENDVHYAFYEFDDLATVQALPGSPALTAMVAVFDRLWQGKVVRSRDIVPNIQQIQDSPSGTVSK